MVAVRLLRLRKGRVASSPLRGLVWWVGGSHERRRSDITSGWRRGLCMPTHVLLGWVARRPGTECLGAVPTPESSNLSLRGGG